MKAKIFLFVSLSLGMLVGCSSNSISVINNSKTQFELAFGVKYLPEYGQYDNRVRFALKPLKGYGQDGKNSNMRWSDSYHFNENNLPSNITIQYAILLDKPTPANENIWEITDRKLQSLPPSAWRTHTIYPKQLLEKGRAMPVYVGFPNEPYAKNDPKRFNYGTRVIVTLYVDGNGNISQEIAHKPISRDRFQ